MKSIIQKDKRCFICGTDRYLESHHAMHGTANRKIADRYGLTVWLCAEHHRGTQGVHGRDGKDIDLHLKQTAQEAFESIYNHDMWMNLFGRNYL